VKGLHMRRILVLENYLPTSQGLALVLQRAGCEVDLVATDRAALAALAHRTYGMLLMDLDIPTGDGWHVLEALQTTPRLVPIVAMLESGDSRQRHARTLGVHIILPKPVRKAALLAALLAILGDPDGQRGVVVV
jgi:CheY-like chemotaxis protein